MGGKVKEETKGNTKRKVIKTDEVEDGAVIIEEIPTTDVGKKTLGKVELLPCVVK